MYNNKREAQKKEIITKNNLFTINTNYNSSEINKVMKSSTNIFTHLSPLLTETLTSFSNPKINNNLKTLISNNSRNKYFQRNKNSMKLLKQKSPINYLKTHSNFHSIDNDIENEYLLGPKNPPSIFDKNNLTSFYKISGDLKNSNKSPEEKLLRDKLFEKYEIKKNRYRNIFKKNDNVYNLATQSNFFHPKGDNAHFKIEIRYFKNFNKATKTIDINKQLVKRVNEMTNFFLLQKYSQKIENNQMKKYYEKKMPKIHIRVQTKKNKFLKKSLDFEQLENDEEKEKENENEKKITTKKLRKKKNEIFGEKKVNSLGAIKLSYFRKFAYNGLIEPELIEDFPEITEHKEEKDLDDKKKKELEKIRKMNKLERHYLSLKIVKKINGFKPNSRVDFSITKFGNKIYLFGGVSSKIYNELWTYNIDTNKWDKIIYDEKEEPIPRKGHTSVIIKNTIFIFGGETTKDATYEDLVTYNIILNKFYYPKISKKRKINQRKGHIMIGTNQTFLIQGGIDLRTSTLENSAYIYNIIDNYWERLDYRGKPLPYRAYHCCTMVSSYINHTLSAYTFYSLPDDISDEVKSKIRYEGIYIFGGINEKKMYCNDLFILKTGNRPCINIKPKISGKPPEPRIHAKMLFIENYFFVIIHGGIKINQTFCDNIAVLNLENYNWIKPIIDDEGGTEKRLIGRTKHEIFFNNDKLYILGGLGDDNMLPLNFEIVQFEVTGFFNNLLSSEEDV